MYWERHIYLLKFKVIKQTFLKDLDTANSNFWKICKTVFKKTVFKKTVYKKKYECANSLKRHKCKNLSKFHPFV